MEGSICAAESAPRERPMEQSESLSPAEESTSVMEDINRWDLVWWTRDQGVGGAFGSGREGTRAAKEGAARARAGRERRGRPRV